MSDFYIARLDSRVFNKLTIFFFVNNASENRDEISFKNKFINSCIGKFVSSHLFSSVVGKQPDLPFNLLVIIPTQIDHKLPHIIRKGINISLSIKLEVYTKPCESGFLTWIEGWRTV